MKYVLLVLLLIGKTAWCQNLVPNPSFETIVNCPTHNPENAVGWMKFSETTDLFSVCNNGTPENASGVPYAIYGFQEPFDGDSYIGILAHVTAIDWPDTLYREYLAIELTQPLIVGEAYISSAYFSNATDYSVNGASNKVGLKFTTVNYDNYYNPLAPHPLMNNYAQVYTNDIISDSLNWVKVEGEFVADSAYTYLCIGNFFNDSHTSFQEANGWLGAVYYYVDAVSVSPKYPTTSANNLPQGADFSIYPNPSHQAVNLTLPQGTTQIEIFNAVGQSVYASNVTSLHQIVDVSLFSEGIYFVRIQSHQGVQTQKFVVQR